MEGLTELAGVVILAEIMEMMEMQANILKVKLLKIKNMPEKLNQEMLIRILIHGSFAFLGGITRYLSNENKPKLLNILFQGLIGSFVGVVFGLVASCFFDSQYFQLAFAGGNATISLLILQLRIL